MSDSFLSSQTERGEMIKQFYLALSPEWRSHEYGKVLLRQTGVFALRRRPKLKLMAPENSVLVREHISASIGFK